MTLNNLQVNNLLKCSKYVIERINSEKDYSDEFNMAQMLVFAGLLSFYGTKNFSKIYRAFSNVDFVVYNGNLGEEMKNRGISDEQIDDTLKKDVPAFLNRRFDYLNLFIIDRTIFTFFDKESFSAQILENITHEINHVLNSLEKEINFVAEDEVALVRSGLAYDKCYLDGSVAWNYLFLEEGFNTLQAEEIVNIILSFKNYDIDDPQLIKMINLLKQASGEKFESNGYKILLPVIKPLYDCESFNSITTKCRLDGNIDEVKDNFDTVTENGMYDLLNEYLERMTHVDNPLDYYSGLISANRIVKRYTK